MNITNITDKILSRKWMMEKKSLYNFYNVLQNLQNARVGGLKGLLLGDTPLVKVEQTPSIVPSDNVGDFIGESGNMSIVSVSGILTKGASALECELLGMQDTDEISNAIDESANDPSVSSVVIAFSSPGGETTGIEELGRKIRDIDTNIKPIYGWTETHAASAAYWLLSQTRKIGMTPSSQVGSVGVYMLVLDATGKYKQEGINVQAISSGYWKLMGHDFNPLSKEEEEFLLKDVQKQHEKFKQVILEKRPGVKPESLEGLSYEGSEALDNGLVDVVVDDFDEFLAEI